MKQRYIRVTLTVPIMAQSQVTALEAARVIEDHLKQNYAVQIQAYLARIVALEEYSEET